MEEQLPLQLNMILKVLSVSAIVTTIALFFCGIPICWTIRKQNKIGDISGIPFIMGLLGGSFWLRYGLLKIDWTMVIVNLVGVSFFTGYCAFYLKYSLPKKVFAAQLTSVILVIISMIIWISLAPNLDYLGIICMTFNILNFGAPLAGLGVVLRRRNVSTLPLPMCIANFLVSSQWFLYGYLVEDLYVIVPNGIGMILAVIQLSLFIILPRHEEERSPLEKLAAWFTGRQTSKVQKGDEEEEEVEEDENDDIEKGVTIGLDANKACQPELSRSLHEKIEKLLSASTNSESRRESIDFFGRPPSYKSRSNSVPDISSLQSF